MKQYLALLAGVILSFNVLAQQWRLTGTKQYIDRGLGGSDIAIAPNHTPYITFTTSSDRLVRAMKFDGAEWIDVGAAMSATSSFEPSIAIDASGVPFVGFVDADNNDGKATVKKFNGTVWETVGQAGFSTSMVDNLQMEIGNDGTPYLCFKESITGKATVMKYDGANWVTVGTAGFSPAGVTSLGLTFHPDGTPYVAYLDQSGKGTVVKYNGSQWVTVGNAQFTSGSSSYLSLDIDSQGNPYIAYSDAQNAEKAVVMKFTGTEWVFIGANGFSATDAPFIKIVLYDETPYVVYVKDPDDDGYAIVEKYTGSAWEVVGDNAVVADSHPGLVIHPDGADGLVMYLVVGQGTVFSPMFKVETLTYCPLRPTNTTPAAQLSVCPGGTTTLSASMAGGNVITWYDEAGSVLGTGNEYITAALTSDTKFYAGTSRRCGTPISVTVSSPVITITGSATVCKGESITLTASGANTYTWEDGPNTATYTVSPAETTTYTVTGKDANNCSSTASRMITVNALPVVAIAGETTICEGESTTLTASGTNTYAWQDGPNTAMYTVSPTETTTYTVIGTDANNCSVTSSKTIVVNVSPVITIAGKTTICKGESTLLTASGANTYAWHDGPNTATHTVSPAETTTYTVTGTGGNSCRTTASTTITVNALPVVKVSGATVICPGSSTTLAASGAESYQWAGGPATESYVVSPATVTTYSVTGTDANNCASTASLQVTVKAVNTAVSIQGITLVAEATPATYQWINCDQNGLVVGAVNKSFTPHQTGNYAVMVSQNLCVSTSDCINVIIMDVQPEKPEQILTLYPNPSKGSITVSGVYRGSLKLMNSLGQAILEFELNEHNNYSKQLDHLGNGVYYITFSDAANRIVQQKIIVGD